MRKSKVYLGLLGGILFSLGVFTTFSCEKPMEKAVARSMMVVFVSGDAKIVKGEKETLAKVGAIVQENDVIKTTNGTVDLQTQGGSAIRIREFTTVTIEKLLGPGTDETKLGMRHGSLLATVKRQASKENFTVVTPTAIAGVRGTTFSVEVDEGRQPLVKVLDGRVAMAPRIMALEDANQTKIESTPALTRMAAFQKEHEVILEPETAGTLHAGLEKKVSELNGLSDQNTESLDTIIGDLDTTENHYVEQKKTEITPQELAEKSTLVTIDSAILDEAMEKALAGEAVPVDKIEAQRQQRQEVVLEEIQKEASKKQLNSEKEIQNYYNKLETVILNNGEQHSGAVIAQTGNFLVVHTASGVIRLKKSEVSSIEYK